MKLATLKKSSSRDGELVVVSRDLRRFRRVSEIAATLQAALDHWADLSPELDEVYRKLNAGTDGEDFAAANVAAPLPRAYQWCDGSAYLSHAELARKARGASMPEFLYSDPLMYQGGSDVMLGARDDIELKDESWGLDLEAEIAVVTDDVPLGVAVDDAHKHIVLIMTVNDISLRNLMKTELEKGFGFLHSKPPTAFSPVAVTPDELGAAWDGAKVNLPLRSYVNGVLLGEPDAGKDLYFDFARLVSHAAKSRPLTAGTIVGSGTVSNRELSVGSSCLVERRMLEQIASGAPKTAYLRAGDTVRIVMDDAAGKPLFGAIEQKVVTYE